MTNLPRGAPESGGSLSGDGREHKEVTLVGPRATILVVAPWNDSLVGEFKVAVLADDPVQSVVATLSSAGARNLPPFGCVVDEGSCVRVLVRGSVTAHVLTGGATRTISADDVSTWAEQVYVSPTEIRLESRSSLGSTRLVLLFTGSVCEPGPVSPDGDSARATASSPDFEPGNVSVSLTSASVKDPAELDSLTLTSNQFPIAVGTAPEEAEPASEGNEFDFGHLLDETHFRGVEAAAVRDEVAVGNTGQSAVPTIDVASVAKPTAQAALVVPAEPVLRPVPSAPAGLISGVPRHPWTPVRQAVSPAAPGDHDGNTIAVSAVRDAVAAARSASSTAGPSVQAVRCTAGHLNAPNADGCRCCSAPIIDRSILAVDRGSLGRLRFADGLVVELDRPVLIGRNPNEGADGDAEAFGLITLPDPERALSRIHVEVRLEGWQVLIVDRNAVNGTSVKLPGKPVRRLRPDDPFLITPGTQVTLADVTSFVYEVAVA